MIYPLGKPGKVIGGPFQGTHAKAFNVAGGSDNWESENAVDIATPIGTPVRAVSDGTIGSAIGSLGSGGRFAGLRLHLVTGDNEYYFAHLSKIVVKAGQRVKAGDILGYSGSANGVAHLHFGEKNGSPLTLVNSASSSTPSATSSSSSGPSATSRVTAAAVGAAFGPLGGIAGAVVPDQVNNVADAALGVAQKGASLAIGALWDSVSKDATRALLYVVLVGAGVALALTGLNLALGGAPGQALKSATNHIPVPV